MQEKFSYSLNVLMKKMFYFTSLCWKYSENKFDTCERKIANEIT